MRHNLQGVILCLVHISHTEANKTDDNIAGSNLHRITTYAYSITRCCLTCNGDISFCDIEFATKVYPPCNIKHNGPFTTLGKAIAQRPFTAVICQRCDVIYRTSATSGSIHSAAFRAGESPGLTVLFYSRDFKVGICYLYAGRVIISWIGVLFPFGLDCQ